MVETVRSFGVQVGLDASRFSAGINAVNGACTSSTKKLGNVGTAINSMQNRFTSAGTKGSTAMRKVGIGVDRLYNGMMKLNPMIASFVGGMVTAAGAVGLMKLREMSDELVTVELNVSRANVMLGGTPALVSNIVSQLDIFATKIPGTATEISDSIYLIVSAMDKVGKSAEEVFAVAMVYVEKFAQAAAITGSDINTITRAVMQMTYAFGGTVEDVDKILGLALKTVAGGFITFDKYAHAVEHASTQAALAGLSLEEMNAAIIIMTTGGVAATLVGSRLAGAITYLTKSAGTLKPKFEAVGVEVYNLETGKMKPLIEIIDILTEKTKGLTDLEMAEWFHEAGIVGVQVKQGLIPLMQGYDKLGMTIEDLTNVQGILQDQFDAISGTLWAKLDAVRSSIRMVWKASAEAIMVILSPFINIIIKMGAVFANLPRPMKLTIGLFLALGTSILVVSGAILTMWGMIGMMGMGINQAGAAGAEAVSISGKVTAGFGRLNQKLAVTKASLFSTTGILGVLKAKLIAVSLALKGFILNLWATVGGVTGVNASISAVTLKIKAFTLQQFFARLGLGKFTGTLLKSTATLKAYSVSLWTTVVGLKGVGVALWSVILQVKALSIALITSPVFIWLTGFTVTLFVLYKAFKSNIGGMKTATDDLREAFGSLFDVLGPFRTVYAGVVEGVVSVMRLMVEETAAFINLLVDGINVVTSFFAKVVGVAAPLIRMEAVLKGLGKVIGILIGSYLIYSSVMFSVLVIQKSIAAFKALALAIKGVRIATNLSTISANLNTIALKASSFATWTTTGAKNLLAGATRAAHLARLASVSSLVAEKAALVASTIAMGIKKVATIALTLITKVAIAVQWLWNIALTANPIGVIIMAVAALAAGITWLIVKVIGINRIMSAFAIIGNSVRTAIDWLVNSIMYLVNSFKILIQGVNGAGSKFSWLINGLLLFLGPIGLVILAFRNLDKIKLVFARIVEFLSPVGTAFKSAFGWIVGSVRWLIDSFRNLVNGTEEIGSKFEWLKNGLLLLLGPIGMVILAFKNFDKIKSIVGKTVDYVSSKIGGFVESTKSFGKGIADSIRVAGASAIERIGVTGTVHELSVVLNEKTLISKLKALTGLLPVMLSDIENVFEKSANKIGNLFDFPDFGTRVVKVFDGLKKVGEETAKEILSIKDKFVGLSSIVFKRPEILTEGLGLLKVTQVVDLTFQDDPMLDKLKKLPSLLGPALTKVELKFKSTVNRIGELFDLPDLGSGILKSFVQIRKVGEDTVAYISAMKNRLAETVTFAVKWPEIATEKLRLPVVTQVIGLVFKEGTAIDKLKELPSLLEPILIDLEQRFGKTIDNIGQLFRIPEISTNLLTVLQQTKDKAVNFVELSLSEKIGKVRTSVELSLELKGEILSDKLRALSGSLLPLMLDVESVFKNSASKISEFFSFSDVGTRTVKAFASVKERILSVGKDLKSVLKTFRGYGTDFYQSGVDLLDSLLGGITSRIYGISDSFSKVAESVLNACTNLADNFYYCGTAWISNLLEGTKSAWIEFKDWLVGSLGFIANILPSSEPKFGPLVGLESKGRALVNTFGEGIQKAFPSLTGLFTGNLAQIYKEFNSGFGLSSPSVTMEVPSEKFKTHGIAIPAKETERAGEITKVISPTINFEPHIEVKVEGTGEIDPEKLANDIWYIIRDKQNKYVLDELTRVLQLG